jgi:undecaprenyl pyrophosphate synthase
MKRVFSDTKIKAFTIRGLSTENLHKRSKKELDYLADIYESSIEQAAVFMKKYMISLRWI